MQRRHLAAWGHLVDRTESAIIGGSPEIRLTVEVPISALDETTERVGAVRIVELVDHGKFSLRSDGKDCTVAASVPERCCCPVKLPIRSLGHRSQGKATIRYTVEVMQRRIHALRGYLEDRAAARVALTGGWTTTRGCPIEIPVAIQD